MGLDAKIPKGDLETKWRDYKSHVKLVNPANKRKIEVIVVGTGLAGASAAAIPFAVFLWSVHCIFYWPCSPVLCP